jgi:ABC-2 type transport system permease protein
MRELLLVLNVKAASFLKQVFHWNWQTFFKNLSSLLIFGGFAVAMFFFSRSVTTYLLQQAHIGQFLFHRFLSMLLYVFFITVNLGNMIVCYATLYRSQEVSFLMSMPISHAKIFLIKFVDNFFYSSSTLALIGFSVLLGYGSYFDLPWYYYFFTVFFVFMPFMLIAGVIAVMVLMALIKIASRIGVRWLLAIITTAYLSAIYVYFRVTNPVQLVQEVMKLYPNVNEYFGYLDPPLVQYLPNHWVTEFLYWSVNGNYDRAIPYFSLLFLTMVALVVAAGLMARRFYYESWLAASDARAMSGPKKRRFRLRFMEFGTSGFFKPQTDALFKRDFWLFFREPSQWLHLMLLLLMLMIFLVSVGSLELALPQPSMQAVSFLVVFLFNGFLIASISLRFVFPAVSLESDCFWSVRVSPMSLKKLYWHKFVSYFAPILLVAQLLTVASISMMRDSWELVIGAAVCSAFIALTLTSLNLGAGTYFATFKEKNPIRVASSQGASLTFLVSMVYLGLVVTILIVPLSRYFESFILKGSSQSAWLFVPIAVIAMLSILVFSISTTIGLKVIKRDY